MKSKARLNVVFLCLLTSWQSTTFNFEWRMMSISFLAEVLKGIHLNYLPSLEKYKQSKSLPRNIPLLICYKQFINSIPIKKRFQIGFTWFHFSISFVKKVLFWSIGIFDFYWLVYPARSFQLVSLPTQVQCNFSENVGDV